MPSSPVGSSVPEPSPSPPPSAGAAPVVHRGRFFGRKPVRKKRSALRRVFRFFFFTGLLLLLMGGIAAGTAGFLYYQMAGGYDLAKVAQIPQRSEVFDADGVLYTRIENVNRAVVPLKDVSQYFREAIVAREDERFYQHDALDYQAIGRAISRDLLRPGGRKEGGSTITQQLARNSFPLGTGRTLHRKLLEAMVAVRIEKTHTKDQILEAYVNRIYLGSGVYGVETASQRYFGKRARDLTLGEAATLAGIVRAPNTKSPLRNLNAALHERDLVLERMELLGKIRPGQTAAAKLQGISINPNRPPANQRDYLMDIVRAQLDDLVGGDDLDLGGLKIYTTIDPRLQRAAERAVETRLDKIEATKGYNHPTHAEWVRAHPPGEKRDPNDEQPVPDYLQAAVVAVDNATGAVRAMVGGRDYDESVYNRAWAGKRQVGSTFKPFIYAAAFAKGMQPFQLVDDAPLRPGEIRDAPADWQPANSDGQNLPPTPAEVGLIQSRNVMTIRVGEWAGRGDVHALAARLGLLEDRSAAVPAMLLGVFEATPRAVAGAYAALANKGVFRAPYLIERIDAADGDNIYRASRETPRVLPEAAATTTEDLMQRVFSEGTAKTGRSLGLTVPAAGKTGTTNEYKDAWFAGYTSSLTCAVWVGLDRPQTIAAKGYGAALALPIWVDVIEAACANPETRSRYPALALHAPPRALPVVAGGPATADPGAMPPPPGGNGPIVATVPSAVMGGPNVPVARAQPVQPTDPGSRVITDPRTGQVVGIDGSAGAASEEAARQQRLREIIEQQRVQSGINAPRAVPVGPGPGATTTTTSGGIPVRRAAPVNAGPVPPPSVPGISGGNGVYSPRPAASPAPLPASVDPRAKMRIITLPDGRQVVERTVNDPLNGR